MQKLKEQAEAKSEDKTEGEPEGKPEDKTEGEPESKSEGKSVEGTVSIELLGKKVDISLASEEEEKKFWRDFQNKQQFSGKKTQKWQSKLTSIFCTFLY